MRSADPSSRGYLPSVVCLCVMPKLKKWGGHGPFGAVATQKVNGLKDVTACY